MASTHDRRFWRCLTLGVLLCGIHTAVWGQVPNPSFETLIAPSAPKIIPWITSPDNVVAIPDAIKIPGDTNNFFLALPEGQSAINPEVMLTERGFNATYKLEFQYYGPEAQLECSLHVAESDANVARIRAGQNGSAKAALTDVAADLRIQSNRIPFDLKANLKISVRNIPNLEVEPPFEAFIDNIRLSLTSIRGIEDPILPPQDPQTVVPADDILGLRGIGSLGGADSRPGPSPHGDRLLVRAEPAILIVNQDTLGRNISRIDIRVLRDDGSTLGMVMDEALRDDTDSTIDVEILDNQTGLLQLFTSNVNSAPNDSNSLSDTEWPFDLDDEREADRDTLYVRATRVEDADVRLIVRHKRKETNEDGEDIDVEIATAIPISIRSDPDNSPSGNQGPSRPPRNRVPDERLNRLFRERF